MKLVFSQREVPPLDGPTLHARAGAWPGWLATGIVVRDLVRPAVPFGAEPLPRYEVAS